MDAKDGRWRKVWVRLFQALITVVLVIALAEALVYFLASRKEKQVLDRWAAYGGGTLDENFAALPRHKTDAAARKIEEIAATMGMVNKDAGGNTTYPSLPAALTNYHMAELDKPSAAIAPPTPEVSALLAERAQGMDSLRQALAAGTVPLWESDPDKLYAAPIPPVLLQINLTRLLTADALAALSAGDAGRALADAEAGWTLTQSLEDRPELIARYVSMAETRMWMALLRKVPAAPEVWRERLKGRQPRERLIRSLRFEAVMAVMMARKGGAELTQVGVLSGGFVDTLSVPLMRFWLFDAAGRTLDLVDALERQEPCSGPYDAVSKQVEESIPRWSLLARIAMPNLSDGWMRAERYALDAELTQKVLQLKAGRGGDGAWPPVPAGFEACFCPKAKWVASVQDGALTVSLENGPTFSETASWNKYPLRYEEPAPAPKK